jgi:hypothetical protein
MGAVDDGSSAFEDAEAIGVAAAKSGAAIGALALAELSCAPAVGLVGAVDTGGTSADERPADGGSGRAAKGEEDRETAVDTPDVADAAAAATEPPGLTVGDGLAATAGAATLISLCARSKTVGAIAGADEIEALSVASPLPAGKVGAGTDVAAAPTEIEGSIGAETLEMGSPPPAVGADSDVWTGGAVIVAATNAATEPSVCEGSCGAFAVLLLGEPVVNPDVDDGSPLRCGCAPWVETGAADGLASVVAMVSWARSCAGSG